MGRAASSSARSISRASVSFRSGNRDWVAANGLFEPHVQRFLTRLKELAPA